MKQKSDRKKKLGSYPFLSVVFSITLSLVVLGMFGLLLILTNTLTTSIRENVEVQVYLSKPISKSEISRIQKVVGSKPYLTSGQDANPIRYISKEKAAEEFLQSTGEDFSQFLGDNPLRDVLMVKIDPSYQAADSLSWITQDIESIRGVYEVNYVSSLVEKINQNLAKVGAIFVGLGVMFIVLVVLLINNTIKLALYSQRFLIRSMQLVGATGSFIRKPFLQRAVLYGISAGVIASVSIMGVYQYLQNLIVDLQSLYDLQKMLILYASIILLGIFVAYLSTFRAIRKYLKLSLDELY